jgi:ABC-type transporter Mla subunit MlaD
MASHQVDRAIDAVDDVLRQLKQAMRGIPARREGFKRHHDNLAKAAATLTVSLSDARHTIPD